MLNQPMMEKLLAMRLQGMVEALKTQEQDRAINELSFLERLALLVDQQWSWRENQALARRLKAAKLRGSVCVEDIDYRTARGLDKTVVRALARDSAWVCNHENIFVLGPTGVGKSFIASALAQKACRDGYSALYLRAAALLCELALARADGSLRHLLARLDRIDVLVIDDWAMAPLNESERREVWEICEDRYQTRSTILTSQLPVSRWHEQIGDPTIADGILDPWFTMPTASRCAESPCGRNAIRRRPRRKNEPKSISLSAKWRYYANNRFADHTHPPPRWTGGFFVSSHPEAADVTDEGPPQNENRFWQRSGLLSSGMVCHGFVVKGSSKSVDCRNISF